MNNYACIVDRDGLVRWATPGMGRFGLINKALWSIVDQNEREALRIKQAMSMTMMFGDKQELTIPLTTAAWHPDTTTMLIERINGEREILVATLNRAMENRLLSEREAEVLRLICEGKSTLQIAGELHITEATVATYRAKISEKTGTSGVAQMVRWAILHELYHG